MGRSPEFNAGSLRILPVVSLAERGRFRFSVDSERFDGEKRFSKENLPASPKGVNPEVEVLFNKKTGYFASVYYPCGKNPGPVVSDGILFEPTEKEMRIMVKKIELLKKEIEVVKKEHKEELEILRSEQGAEILSGPGATNNPFEGNPFIDMSEYEDRCIDLSEENGNAKVVKFPGSAGNGNPAKESPFETLTRSVVPANAVNAEQEGDSKSGYGGVSGYARWARDGYGEDSENRSVSGLRKVEGKHFSVER